MSLRIELNAMGRKRTGRTALHRENIWTTQLRGPEDHRVLCKHLPLIYLLTALSKHSLSEAHGSPAGLLRALVASVVHGNDNNSDFITLLGEE